MKPGVLGAVVLSVSLFALPSPVRGSGSMELQDVSPPRHFWAAVSEDQARVLEPEGALQELRSLYSQEEDLLRHGYQNIAGLRLYDGEASGRLWAVHKAIARREAALGLPADDWDLPPGTVAVPPLDYPGTPLVRAAMERAVAPAGALTGLPVFLVPMHAPRTAAWAVSYGSPWLDEAVVLFSYADEEAFLHELGHVIHRQVLDGVPGLDAYLTDRMQSGNQEEHAWANIPGENLAEDYRVGLAGGTGHRGSWGPPTIGDRERLGALLAVGRKTPSNPEFTLSDLRAGRLWQPFTGLRFVTDEAQVLVKTADSELSLHGELCRDGQCFHFAGNAPLALPLGSEGTYHLTVANGPDVWLRAEVVRVKGSVQPAVRLALVSTPCKGLGAPGTASALLREAAKQQGWGEFPLQPAAIVLGNGWDQDPASQALLWARLTGTVDPMFGWIYRPGDRVPPEVARQVLTGTKKTAGVFPAVSSVWSITLYGFEACYGRIGDT